MKPVVALAALAMAFVIAGCSAKPDVGDAEVKMAPGTAKMPQSPVGAGGGGGPTAGGPKPSTATPQVPK